jgi:hypothetical protein
VRARKMKKITGARPNPDERERIEKQGLDSRQWLVLPSSTKNTLHIINLFSGKVRHLPWQK